jgi:hypothetical protein
MIRDVDKVVLEFLQKGLSGHIPSDDIYIGEFDPQKPKSISLVCSSFTVEEEGIGGSGGVKREKITDDFSSDGKKTDFKLSQKPIRPLISVEIPAGTIKNTPDDYTIDYDRSVITLRVIPEKKKVIRVTYNIDRPVAETRDLRFFLTYRLTIGTDNQEESDMIALETIKVLYRERSRLEKGGISEMRLIRGFVEMLLENKGKTVNVLEYEAQTTVQIELPMPPIDRITIEKG